MDKDEIYLAEIKEFCRKIIGYTANLSYEQFLGDEKLQLAVVKLIENVGGCRQDNPQISQITQKKKKTEKCLEGWACAFICEICVICGFILPAPSPFGFAQGRRSRL